MEDETKFPGVAQNRNIPALTGGELDTLKKALSKMDPSEGFQTMKNLSKLIPPTVDFSTETWKSNAVRYLASLAAPGFDDRTDTALVGLTTLAHIGACLPPVLAVLFPDDTHATIENWSEWEIVDSQTSVVDKHVKVLSDMLLAIQQCPLTDSASDDESDDGISDVVGFFLQAHINSRFKQQVQIQTFDDAGMLKSAIDQFTDVYSRALVLCSEYPDNHSFRSFVAKGQQDFQEMCQLMPECEPIDRGNIENFDNMSSCFTKLRDLFGTSDATTDQ